MSATPELSASVLQAINWAFAPADRIKVITALRHYGIETHEAEQERVRIAIVKLSHGSPEEVVRLVQRAKGDYRDILYWMELEQDPAPCGPTSA